MYVGMSRTKTTHFDRERRKSPKISSSLERTNSQLIVQVQVVQRTCTRVLIF